MQDLPKAATDVERDVEEIISISLDEETDVHGLPMRKPLGLDLERMQTTRGNLVLKLAGLNELDEKIEQKHEELRAARLVENDDAVRNLESKRSAMAEAISVNERILRSQIPRIKETINRMLEKDVTLGDKITTLFREQGVTIVSILTAISLAISTIVASVVASVIPIPTPTPPAPRTPGSSGVKKNGYKKSLKSIQLAKETRIKSIGRITGYNRRSIELVIIVSLQSGRMARGARVAISDRRWNDGYNLYTRSKKKNS